MSDAVPETGVKGPTQRRFTPTRTLTAALLSAGALLALVAGGMYWSGQHAASGDTVKAGSLGPAQELAGSQQIGAQAITGQVTVSSRAALFDAVDGVSIARLDAGVYDAIESVPGWAQVVVASQDQDGLFTTGWVVLNDVSTHRLRAA